MSAHTMYENRSDATPMERVVCQLITRIRKLRWMGMDAEAERLQDELQSALHQVDSPRDTLLGEPRETD